MKKPCKCTIIRPLNTLTHVSNIFEIMSTYTQFTLQVVFGSMYRSKFLPRENEDLLFSYFGGILRKLDCYPLIQGWHLDHIHLVFAISRRYAISKIVQEVKKGSNKFIHERADLFPGFKGWQDGYGGFSYDKNGRDRLINYVRNQHIHHRDMSFEEEYIKLLEEHGINYDPKYLL